MGRTAGSIATIRDMNRRTNGSIDSNRTTPIPADPPQADVSWPENVGMHDQVATAMLDFLTTADDTPKEQADTVRQLDVLVNLGESVPPDRSVSVLVELDDGHVLATMLNSIERGPVITVLHYGHDDPDRMNDPAHAGVLPLSMSV